jgi:hypothetical protein
MREGPRVSLLADPRPLSSLGRLHTMSCPTPHRPTPIPPFNLVHRMSSGACSQRYQQLSDLGTSRKAIPTNNLAAFAMAIYGTIQHATPTTYATSEGIGRRIAAQFGSRLCSISADYGTVWIGLPSWNWQSGVCMEAEGSGMCARCSRVLPQYRESGFPVEIR